MSSSRVFIRSWLEFLLTLLILLHLYNIFDIFEFILSWLLVFIFLTDIM